ncbi:MAG: Asp-tRNA(Asn)/Glu-tRNA(Gln) amidotransferase subunit GatA [Spirochaetales bacterium]|nr:Asp-tRNA(Asn)/Glu-tRNA(Gln) amidotransferase subunit GatA [Spirochaetales bacterium]
MITKKEWKKALGEGKSDYTAQVLAIEKNIGSFLEFDPGKGKKTAAAFKANYIADDSATAGTSLEGLPFAVKDNIAVKGFSLTCGSKILKNFTSPYSATAVEKLMNAGAVPVGKTNMDEFGMGSSTDDSALGRTNNPWDENRVVGGSSGGSAAAVAAGLAAFSLGSDTGGSVRQPAAFCGVYGLKPTYGVVSRYGLVAYASSLEVVGALSRDINILKEVFEVMRGKDILDNTSVAHPADKNNGESEKLAPLEEGAAIGVLSGNLGLAPAIAESYAASTRALMDLGYKVHEVELPTLEWVVPAYYTIATAEASANLARFNGIKYGLRVSGADNPDDLVRDSRHEGFGPEVKLRILLGTYVLRSGFQDRYYIKSQKIRTAIREDFKKVFDSASAIMMPVFPTQAFPHGEAGLDPFQQKVADKFTSAANLAALPAMSVPTMNIDGLPTGIQFMAPTFREDRLFTLAEKFKDVFPVTTAPVSLKEGGVK